MSGTMMRTATSQPPRPPAAGYYGLPIPPEATSRPTLEVALHFLLVCLGILLRLFLLDQRPLTVEEGTLALESHQVWQGEHSGVLSRGPLMAYGGALLQALFAEGDGAARLLEAIAGSVLVAAPFMLRHSIGRLPALVAAAGIAFSPLLLFGSRQAGGGVVPVALMALLWAVLSAPPPAGSRWRLYGAAILLAALVACGRDGLVLLATAVVAAALAHPHPTGLAREWGARLATPSWRNAPWVFVAALAAIATGLGTNLSGLQSVLVDEWVALAGSFSLSSTRGAPVAILALYELPIAILALAKIVRSIGQRDGPDGFLSSWAMLLLLVGMLQSGPALPRLMPALFPLYLMAARQVADTALAASDRGSGWRWVLASAATAVPIGVAIVLLNRLSNTTLEQPPVEFLFGEAGLILVGLLCFLFLLTGRERGALAWYSLAILAVGYLLHSSFFLSYREESLAFEPAAGTQLSPYLRDAARTAAYFSAHLGMPVTVDPGLRAATAWYLRDARDVRYGQDATDGSLIRLVAGDQASAQDGLPRRPGLYQPAIDARQLNWRGLWRWAVDRTGLVRANARDIIARTPSGNW